MKRHNVMGVALVACGVFLGSGRAMGAEDAGADTPTIAKDSVQVNAFTLNSYQKNYDVWSWVPEVIQSQEWADCVGESVGGGVQNAVGGFGEV